MLKQNMKIALIGQKGIPAKQGGIERHVEELSTRLALSGLDVSVYSRPHYSGNQTTYNGVNIINLPSIKTKHLDAISHTLFSTIHALFQDYDVIHYHGVGPSLLSWIPRLFKPQTHIISTFHCLDRKHQKWNGPARLILSLGERAACRFPHQTITVSKTLKKYCEYRFDQKTDYIPNGFSVDRQKSNHSILKKYNLKKDGYILVACRLVRHKGIHTLIEAYQMLNTNKKLVITGDSANTDDYVNEIKKMAKGDNNIIFTEQQVGGNLKALFENAYLFSQPSEAEGLSIGLLEAMAYNTPLLASDIEENVEVIERTALRFKNKNVSDLANKLQYALNNPAKIKLKAIEAKKLVHKKYNWEDITKETIELYKRPFYSHLAIKLKTSTK